MRHGCEECERVGSVDVWFVCVFACVYVCVCLFPVYVCLGVCVVRCATHSNASLTSWLRRGVWHNLAARSMLKRGFRLSSMCVTSHVMLTSTEGRTTCCGFGVLSTVVCAGAVR